AYRVLGMVFRETGRPALAEARLRPAIELALSAGAVLHEAEASRELALLHQAMGRNQEALTLLNAAHRLFGQLDARREQVHVNGKMAELEATYLAVVREWGQSIESADPYTFGHCERVARHGVAVARALGMDRRCVRRLRYVGRPTARGRAAPSVRRATDSRFDRIGVEADPALVVASPPQTSHRQSTAARGISLAAPPQPARSITRWESITRGGFQ